MREIRPSKTKKVFLTLLLTFSLFVASFPIANAQALYRRNFKQLIPLKPQQENKTNYLSTNKLPSSLQVADVNVARSRDGRVLVSWQDGGARASLGFNVYREAALRGLTKLNPSLIVGANFNFEPLPNEPIGGHFAWWDDQKVFGRPQTRTYYWIEFVGLDGVSGWHGPFAVSKTQLDDTELIRSRMVSELVRTDGASQDVLQETASTESFSEKRNTESKQPESIQTTQFELAGGVAAKAYIEKNGVARISRAALEAAGISFANPNTIKVFDTGNEVAVTVTPGGDIEFYGQGIETPTTLKRVYWVANVNDSVNGKRIQQINAGPFDNGVATSFFTSTTQRRDRFQRSFNVLNGSTDNFFGSLIGNGLTAQSVSVRGLNQGAAEQATLTVGLQGLTLQAHNVNVKLNGTDVGTVTLQDRGNTTKQFQVPHSLLREGKNNVTLNTTVSTTDFVLADFVRIAYSRQYKAAANSLRFTTQDNQAVRVDGFTNNQVKVFDVTDPLNTKEMIVAPNSNGNGTFSFTLPQGAARSFFATASGAQYQPATIANEPSTLNLATNAANFVIVTHSRFKQSLEPLKTLRQSQGLTVKIVDVEDVYDEFDFGLHGPVAIRNFLNHASQTWQTPPQYAMMVGDAHFDPKDYISSGGVNIDLVPTRLVDSLFTETASDDWLSDFNNDGLPEIAIGRIAVRNVSDANIVVSKLINYDNLPAGSTIQNGVLMVSDFENGYNFVSFTNDVSTTFPGTMTVQHIVAPTPPADVAPTRNQIKSSINVGPGIVNYLGHGQTTGWSNPLLLNAADISASTNGQKTPLLVALTCLNGSFIENIDSLAEGAQKAPNGGAIGVWASTGLTFPFGQVAISKNFYMQLFSASPPRIGDAIKQAKTATTDMDVRHLTVYLGDPTMRLR